MFGGSVMTVSAGLFFFRFAKREAGDTSGQFVAGVVDTTRTSKADVFGKACSVVVIQHGVSVGSSQVRSGAVVWPAWSCSDALWTVFSRRSGGGDGHGDAGDGKG